MESIFTIGWYFVFGVLGIAYIISWFNASNHCNNKWVMLTPFWVLMNKSFDEEGARVCKRGIKITLIIIGTYLIGEVFNLV